MNKNLTLGLCGLALLLSACAPATPSAASVATAIALTQAAIPTNTPLPTATSTATPSATASATPTPNPTNTTAPTATNTQVPTATPAPTKRPPLSDLSITASDINGLLGGAYYRDIPIDATRNLGDRGLDRVALDFFSDRGAGDLLVSTILWASDIEADSQASGLFKAYLAEGGEVLTVPVTLNDTAGFLHHTKGDRVILFVAQGDVVVYIDFSLTKGVSPSTGAPFVAQVGIKQMNLLARAGYGK